MFGWVLDLIPWWIWAIAGGVALAASLPWWRPIWLALPSSIKAALLLIGTGGLAYLAGRNRGASGALQRAKDKEQARADDIFQRGTEARARAERDADTGRLRDDDGWRRDG